MKCRIKGCEFEAGDLELCTAHWDELPKSPGYKPTLTAADRKAILESMLKSAFFTKDVLILIIEAAQRMEQPKAEFMATVSRTWDWVKKGKSN